MSFSKYPASIDDSASIPPAIDNTTPISAVVYNRVRDAIIAIQTELGTQPSREFGTVRARLDALIGEFGGAETDLALLETKVNELRAEFDALKITVETNTTNISTNTNNINSHISNTDNPHNVTLEQLGAVEAVESTNDAVVRFSGTSGAIKDSPNGPFADEGGRTLGVSFNTNITTQANVYINPTTGNDQNSGNIDNPLETFAEYTRRAENRTIEVAQTIHIIGTLNESNYVVLGNHPLGLTITGQRTDLETLTVESARQWDTDTTPIEDALINVTGFDFTPYVGEMITVTSGTAAGNVAWILAVNPGGLGTDFARVTPWFNPFTFNSNAPSNSDEIKIVSLTNVKGPWKIYDYNRGSDNFVLFTDLHLESEEQLSIFSGSAGFFSTAFCKINGGTSSGRFSGQVVQFYSSLLSTNQLFTHNNVDFFGSGTLSARLRLYYTNFSTLLPFPVQQQVGSGFVNPIEFNTSDKSGTSPIVFCDLRAGDTGLIAFPLSRVSAGIASINGNATATDIRLNSGSLLTWDPTEPANTQFKLSTAGTEINIDGNPISVSELTDSGSLFANGTSFASEIKLFKRDENPSSVPNSTFLFSKDDNGTIESFHEDSEGFVTQLVRDGSILNSLNVRDFGAVPGVPGGGDAIQDAINKFINNIDKFNSIIIPPGHYFTTKPLLAIPTGGIGFQKTVMVSSGRFPLNSAGFGGTIISLEGDGYQDWPVMIVQGGRGCYFEGITFRNTGNLKPQQNAASGANAPLIFKDRDDWITPGARTNPRSPNCAVAIDPFTDGYPGSDINNAYPGLEDFYGGPSYSNPAGSSATTFKHCSFRNAFVGVASSPPGDIGGVDVIANNENNLYDQCSFVHNTYHYASGQSQERGNTLRGAAMYGAWCAVSTEIVGPGGNHGNCPYITYLNLGGTRYVFDINGSQKVTIDNVYIESSASLGKLGVANASVQGGVHIDGLTFSFTLASAIDENTPEIPYHLHSFGLVTLSNVTLNFQTGISAVLRIFHQNGILTLNDFSYIPGPEFDNAHVSVGLNNLSLVRGAPWHTRNLQIGAVFHNDPVTEIKFHTLSGDPIVQVTQVGASERVGTVSLSSTAGIEIGDLIRVAPNSPTHYRPQIITPGEFEYIYNSAIGQVSDIDIDNSITISRLPYEFPFDTNLRLGVIRWINFDLLSILGRTLYFDILREVLDENDFEVSNNDLITTWVSQDSSSKEIIQSNSAIRPTYDADVLAFNHQPGILFNADGYYLEFTGSKLNTNFLHNGNAASVVVGFSYDSMEPGTLLSTLSNSANNIGIELAVDGDGYFITRIGNGSGTYLVDSNVEILEDGYAYVASIRHSTTGSPQFDVRINGVSIDSGSYVGSASASNSTDNFTVGSQAGGNNGFGSHMFVIFGSVIYLTDNDISNIEDRLLNRIGQ